MPHTTQPANGELSLQRALSAIEHQFGKGTVMRLGDHQAHLPVRAISTGALALDLALGCGGLPRGRIVEVYGPESSGKTTLVYHVIAEAQKQGGTCAFIDAEHSMDPGYAGRIGVDVDSLLVSQPDYGEQALQVADMLVQSRDLAVVCIDSVAALTPKAEIEGQMGDQTVGLMARMMSQALRKLAGNLSRADTLCLFTNQLREKIGVMYGSPETTPGGRALRFYASQRLDIRRIETIKDGTEAIANRVRVKVVKNKLAAPFRQAEFELEFGTGFSTVGAVLDVGVAHGVVTRSGAFYTYDGKRLGQGRANVKAYLSQHAEVTEAIRAAVYRELGVANPNEPPSAARGSAATAPPQSTAANDPGGATAQLPRADSPPAAGARATLAAVPSAATAPASQPESEHAKIAVPEHEEATADPASRSDPDSEQPVAEGANDTLEQRVDDAAARLRRL